MHPGMRTLNDPLNLSRAAAAWFPASGNTGRNAARVPDAPVLVATVASIRVDALRPAERPTANAVDWLNRLDDGNPLRNVVAVGASQDCRDRRTVGFGGCASAAGPATKLPTIRTCPVWGVRHPQAVRARWCDGFARQTRWGRGESRSCADGATGSRHSRAAARPDARPVEDVVRVVDPTCRAGIDRSAMRPDSRSGDQ
ncbi:transposase domain protein [Burkholderia mallei]|nr:transposase domain protein [Burkholderia mallei]